MSFERARSVVLLAELYGCLPLWLPVFYKDVQRDAMTGQMRTTFCRLFRQ